MNIFKRIIDAIRKRIFYYCPMKCPVCGRFMKKIGKKWACTNPKCRLPYR